MTDRNRTDDRFDEALLASLSDSALPPEEAVRAANPSRRAARLVLIGLALCSVTWNIGWLPYLLPVAGHLCSLLGFRALSRENGWFRAAYGCAWVRAAYGWAWLILLNVPGGEEWADAYPWKALVWLSAAALLFEVFSLGRGLSTVRRAAGLEAGVPASDGLLVWYAVIIAASIAFPDFTGGISALIILLGSYLMILRALFRTVKEFEETEYAIRSAPVRVSDGPFAVLMLAVLLACLVATGIAFARLPMDWQADAGTRSADAASAASELEELGFPRAVLEDLTNEEILACRGASRAVVKVYENRSEDGGLLRFTNIGLRMSDEGEETAECYVILHFAWIETPRVCGTDCFHLWEYANGRGEVCSRGEVNGRLLCDRDGTRCAADYASLGRRMLSGGAMFPFFNTVSSEEGAEIVGEFSFDGRCGRMRGYVFYPLTVSEGWYVNEQYNYTHQASRLFYPRRTAAEMQRVSSAWMGDRTFWSSASALQFSP